jgi:DNA repair exonuclease SbcCD nuclease subunit
LVAHVRGACVAFTGFPYELDVRTRFADVLAQSAWSEQAADVRVLCMHQCVEGATVGPANYTFTSAADVIRVHDIPSGFAAAVSGHIHRRQVLTTDLSRQPLAAPVLYPGSLERTSVAEIGEPKGYMILHVCMDARTPRARWEFRELPARPMIRKELTVEGLSETALAAAVGQIIAAAPADAVLSIRVTGEPTSAQWRMLSAPRLRAIAPRTMNVDVSIPRAHIDRHADHQADGAAARDAQATLMTTFARA